MGSRFLASIVLLLVLAAPALAQEEGKGWGGILADLTAAGVLALCLVALAKHHRNKLSDWETERQESLRAWQEERDKLKAGYVEGKEALRAEKQKEIDELRERLTAGEREHREHVEKLHAENKEIMREVLVTCNTVSQALDKVGKAMDGWTEEE